MNQNDTINITLGIEIVQIISVDERTQQIKFKLWTRMRWRNEFSTWDPQKWSDIRSLKIGPQHVWTPDITLYNDIDDSQLAGECSENTALFFFLWVSRFQGRIQKDQMIVGSIFYSPLLLKS